VLNAVIKKQKINKKLKTMEEQNKFLTQRIIALEKELKRTQKKLSKFINQIEVIDPEFVNSKK
jgi:phage shock protein A